MKLPNTVPIPAPVTQRHNALLNTFSFTTPALLLVFLLLPSITMIKQHIYTITVYALSNPSSYCSDNSYVGHMTTHLIQPLPRQQHQLQCIWQPGQCHAGHWWSGTYAPDIYTHSPNHVTYTILHVMSYIHIGEWICHVTSIHHATYIPIHHVTFKVK